MAAAGRFLGARRGCCGGWRGLERRGAAGPWRRRGAAVRRSKMRGGLGLRWWLRMGGGGEARAPICRAAGWPGRACPGRKARRESRRAGRGGCARKGTSLTAGPGPSGARGRREALTSWAQLAGSARGRTGVGAGRAEGRKLGRRASRAESVRVETGPCGEKKGPLAGLDWWVGFGFGLGWVLF